MPVGPAAYAAVVLDPQTRTARYTDASGRVGDMGRHGTSETSGTVSVFGGGDGQQPQPQSPDGTTTDFALTGDGSHPDDSWAIECNSNGQWGWLPDAPSITEASADILSMEGPGQP